MPRNSWYCSHRSLSRISAAARKRRMSASPRVTGLLEASAVSPKRAPAVTVAPVTPRPFRKDRRRTTRFHCLLTWSLTLVWVSSSGRTGESGFLLILILQIFCLITLRNEAGTSTSTQFENTIYRGSTCHDEVDSV